MLVKASAGMKLTRLGNQLVANGIAGFEFATGIPGCIGGAVRMNAGAYGGSSRIFLSVQRLLMMKVLSGSFQQMNLSLDTEQVL